MQINVSPSHIIGGSFDVLYLPCGDAMNPQILPGYHVKITSLEELAAWLPPSLANGDVPGPGKDKYTFCIAVPYLYTSLHVAAQSKGVLLTGPNAPSIWKQKAVFDALLLINKAIQRRHRKGLWKLLIALIPFLVSLLSSKFRPLLGAASKVGFILDDTTLEEIASFGKIEIYLAVFSDQPLTGESDLSVMVNPVRLV